jgi:hypothetical protein
MKRLAAFALFGMAGAMLLPACSGFKLGSLTYCAFGMDCGATVAVPAGAASQAVAR